MVDVHPIMFRPKDAVVYPGLGGMRLLLAILAWTVMVLGVSGALFSWASVLFVAHRELAVPGLGTYTIVSTLLNGTARIVQSLAIGLGLLYLLHVDAQLRRREVFQEFV